MTRSPYQVIRLLIVLILGWGALYGFMLGSRPLAAPDEGRYVEIPREMVASGDYVTPRLNGVKYFEKPPLFYWLQTLSIRWWGVNEWGLRFWVAAFALMGCVLTYLMGRFLFDPATGLWSSLILATSPLYFGVGHLIILDLPVSVLMSGCLLLFLGQYQARGLWATRLFRWGSFACAGLAVMTKGLMACLLPWGVLGLWILTTPHKRRLRDLFCPWGWCIFLALTVPWHGMVSLRNPEFPWFYFIHEHVLRYVTQVHRRYQPAWFFIPVLFLGFAPWSSFIFPLIRHVRTGWTDERQRLLILWSGFVFFFFSCSSSKLGPYILPIFPALALWVGHHVACALRENRSGILKQTFWIRMSLGCALVGALTYFMRQDASFHTVKHCVLMGCIVLIWASGLSLEWFWGHRQGRWHYALGAMLGMTSIFLLLAGSVAEDIQKISVKPLALAIRSQVQPQDRIIIYGTYYQDLPVYLEQIVGVVDWQGELEFGISVEHDTRFWMMSSTEFWPLWQGPNRVFVLMSHATHAALAQNPQWSGHGAQRVIAETERDIVLSNR